MVSPSSVIVTLGPVPGDHVAPPSTDVRYSSWENPEPPASAWAPAVMVVDASAVDSLGFTQLDFDPRSA